MWRIKSTLDDAGAPHVRRAAIYDRLVRSRLYNKVAWSTAPADYEAFAAAAFGSSGGPLLEVAAGTAAATAPLHARSQRSTVLADLSRPMLERGARRIAAETPDGNTREIPARIRLVQADLFALPFPPHGFTTVLGLGLTQPRDLRSRSGSRPRGRSRCSVGGGAAGIGDVDGGGAGDAPAHGHRHRGSAGGKFRLCVGGNGPAGLGGRGARTRCPRAAAAGSTGGSLDRVGSRMSLATSPPWTALGTYVELAVTTSAALPAAEALLRTELAAIDAACSRFRPDSELSAINQTTADPRRPGHCCVRRSGPPSAQRRPPTGWSIPPWVASWPPPGTTATSPRC